MRRIIALLALLLLAGCNTTPERRIAPDLLNDALFGPPALRVDERDVLALSPDMLAYLHNEMTERLHSRGRRQALLDALYDRGQLKLEYDSAMTRNASEAFAVRSGNCLSLVIMTGAFAREMGLPVRYQTVFTDETWARQGDIYLNVGHVNLSLGPSAMDAGRLRGPDLLTIDFIPGTDLVGAYTRPISETTLVAMYMNNRAAESIAAGELDNAYAFARAAIRHEPIFLPAYNTLGAVYWRHGNAREAAAAFAYVLEREPANRNAMANLVPVLADLGRPAESKALAQRLAALEPEPPFGYFKRGIAALQEGDFRAAKGLFSKEVDRAAYYHEFHYWLAIAEVQLGELDDARRHLNTALEIAGTGREHDIYAAKLQRLSRYR